MTSPADLLETHRIVFQGTIIASAPNSKRHHTDLEISVQEYFAGTGPSIAHVRVEAVDTDRMKTKVHHHGAGRGSMTWTLPRAGGRAVFWIYHHQEAAIIRHPAEIWIISGDDIPALGLSYPQARLRIKAAAESLGWRRQLGSASHAVIARSVAATTRPCEDDDAYLCHAIPVDRQLLGPLISDQALTFRTSARYRKLWYFWRADRGLLLLRAETGAQAHRPTHPTLGFLAQIGDRFVVGYELLQAEGLSTIAPVTLSLPEIMDHGKGG